MYAFLLIIGAVITAAGIALLGSGVSIQEHTFDTEMITPGAVAVVGGLVLVGLGTAVRLLQRIEWVLAVRPLRGSSREATAGTAATETAPRIPFPPKPASNSRQQPATPAVATAPAEDAALERLREKFPTLIRLENSPVVDETEVSLLPRAPARAEEDVGEFNNGIAAAPAQTNGAAPAKLAPRLEARARPASRPEPAKGSMFDAFWPKGPRVGQQPQAAPAEVDAPAPPVEPVQHVQPAPAAALSVPSAHTPRVPISILKSGVVDGMAYTLYSDGSIEAQLPQGTLRFGSITELRNHIEQAS